MKKLKLAAPFVIIILVFAGVFAGVFIHSRDIEKTEKNRVAGEVRAINADNVREIDAFFQNEIEVLGIVAGIMADSPDSLFEQNTGGLTGTTITENVRSSGEISLDGILPTDFASDCLDNLLPRGMNYVALANSDGYFYLHEYEGQTRLVNSVRDRDYFKNAVESGECRLDCVYSSMSGKDTMICSYPVKRGGTVIACIIVSAFQDTLTTVINGASAHNPNYHNVIVDKDYENITDFDVDSVSETVTKLKAYEQGGGADDVAEIDGAFVFADRLEVSSYLTGDNAWRVVTVIETELMMGYLNAYTDSTRTLVWSMVAVFFFASAALIAIFSKNTHDKYALELKQKLILGKFKKYNFEYNAKTDAFYFWPETRKLLGLEKDTYKLSDLIEEGYVFASSKEAIDGYYAELLENGEVKFELKIRNSKHLSVEMYHLLSEKDNFDEFFGFVEDVTSIVAKQELLERQATTDGLTKLFNRETAIAEIEKNIKERPGERKALYIIDIDDFKQINDKYGHYVGDIVLQKVAIALDALSKERDVIVGRLGGDEFCVFAQNLSTMNDVKGLGHLICNRLSMIKISNFIDYCIECSVGISVFPRNGMDFAELYQNADNALYEAKEILDSCYVLYGGGLGDSEKRTKTSDAAMPAETKEDNYGLLLSQGDEGVAKLKNLLSDAIANKEFKTYKQPIVSVKDGTLAAEALARWENPLYGLLNPNKFITLFEKCKEIEALDNYVMELTFKEISDRLAQGKSAVNISVNQSMQTILQPYYLTKIIALIKKYGDIARYITVEITERRLFTGLRTITKVIKRLHDLGLNISIDDFGSGFTTLSILKDLEIDEVKLDKSFINVNGSDSKKSNIIVKQVISMAHELGIKVVAEGVESFEQIKNLIDVGVDCLQGFYLGKAMPDDIFYSRLDNGEFVALDEIEQLPDNAD